MFPNCLAKQANSIKEHFFVHFWGVNTSEQILSQTTTIFNTIFVEETFKTLTMDI